MLKCNKERYDDFRQKADEIVIRDFMGKALKSQEIQIKEGKERYVAIAFLSGLMFYLFENPDKYIDLGKFVIYRSSNLENLLTFEAKDGENARTIFNYYEQGGLYSEELLSLIRTYAESLIVQATEDEAKAEEHINRLKAQTNKSQKA